jgi:hypothetical protein
MTAHALLAPSAAARWMACPGSVRLTEGRDDGGSVYSREGSAAHALARHCLETRTDAASYLGRVIGEQGFTTQAADGDVTFAVTAEMADAVQVYVEAVRPYTALEDHLIEATVATPIDTNCFGTLDFGAYDAAARRLTVADLKYGKGVIVEAAGNKQLLTYAAGLLSACRSMPGCDAVDEIELVVVQPRRLHRDGPVRQAIHTIAELEAHVAAARRAAALIERDPPILNAGEHCRFCRAQSFCPAFLNIAQNDRAPERSQLHHRGTETETMSKFKDQIIDANSKPAQTTQTAVAKPSDNPWLAYGAAASTRSFNGDLLKFSKGDYSAGQDNREIPTGTRVIADMDSLKVGWMKWEDSRPVDDSHMGLVVERFKPPRRAELGDNDKSLWEVDDDDKPRDPWQFTNNLELASEDGGEQYTFSTSSKGGISAIGELCKAFGEEMHLHPDEWPIIELDVGSYQHSKKSFGRIKFPILKLVGWSPKDGDGANQPPLPLPPAPEPLSKTKPIPKAAPKAATAARF